MANPPKQKGTGGETELRRLIDTRLLEGRETDVKSWAERMPAGWGYDLRVYGADGSIPIEVLATRPDRGQWLVTMRLDDFLRTWDSTMYPADLHIEVKRYRRFSIHNIFEKKFGSKK